MKATAVIASICASVILIVACLAKPKDIRVQEISNFSDSLFAIVKSGDAAAYRQLWPKPGDQLVTSDGKPLRMEIPLKIDQELSEAADQSQADFNALESEITAQLGGRPDTLEKVEYLIQSDPIAKQSGLFKFDLMWIVGRNGKTMALVQPECVRVKRGIIIGDMIMVDHSSEEVSRTGPTKAR